MREYVVGERWTELAEFETWEPSGVEVPVYLELTGGTRAEVEFEVYTPSEIEAELDLSEWHLTEATSRVVPRVSRKYITFTILFGPPESPPFEPSLRLRVNGTPEVRNKITVAARRTDGGLTRIREYTLWAFEEGDIGRVVLEDGPPYSRAGKDDSKFWWADSQSLANPDTGEMLVKAGSMGAGYADAWVVQYLEGDRGFTPSEEDVKQGITIEGQFSLKAFAVGDAKLIGLSYGHATGLVEAGDRSYAPTLAWSLEVDVGAVVTVISGLSGDYIRAITRALDAFDAITDPIQITNKVNDILNAIRRAGLGDLETEVVRYSPEGLRAGQRYRIGAGVKVVSASGGFAGNATAVIGKVDHIRVRIGATPTLELKFNEDPISDTSGMGYQPEDFVGYTTKEVLTSDGWRSGWLTSTDITRGLRGSSLRPRTFEYGYLTDDPGIKKLDLSGWLDGLFYTKTRAPVFIPYGRNWKSPVNALKGSYEAWVRPSGKGDGRIISIAGGIRLETCSEGFRFWYNARITCSDFSILKGQADLKADYTPGEWHHVVGTWYYRGSELMTALYVDGRLVTGTPLGVGERPSWGEWPATFITNPPVEIGEDFDGIIDEVRIYSTVLTSEQVQVRWQAGPSP